MVERSIVKVGDAYAKVTDPAVEQYVERVVESTGYALCLGPVKRSWVTIKSLLDPRKYTLVEREGRRC